MGFVDFLRGRNRTTNEDAEYAVCPSCGGTVSSWTENEPVFSNTLESVRIIGEKPVIRRCRTCKGSGRIKRKKAANSDSKTCSYCDGTGVRTFTLPINVYDQFGGTHRMGERKEHAVCRKCKGKGII